MVMKIEQGQPVDLLVVINRFLKHPDETFAT
jgi:hypothetical protein